MKENAYLKQQRKRAEARDRIVTMWTCQLSLDCMVIALNRLYGFGPTRLERLTELYNELMDEEMCALAKVPDADYHRAKIDRMLTQIVPGTEPWEKRYYCWVENEKYEKGR